MLTISKSMLAVAIGVGLTGGAAQAEIIFGLTTDNQIFSVDSASPGTIISGTAITGLQLNEQVLGIDFRPSSNGVLYGLGSSNRIYTINTTTGAATAVGAPFAPVLSGTNFGFDFNPVPDLIRVVSDSDQNLRVSPVTGQVTNVDGTIVYTGALSSVNPNLAGAAYSNNVGGAQSTTLYVIDTGVDMLSIQNANAGTLTPVGLGLSVDATALLGFDISGATGVAYAAIQTTLSQISQLYTINLGTGVATPVGQFGGGFLVRDLSVVSVPEPTTLGLAGLAVVGLMARRRKA